MARRQTPEHLRERLDEIAEQNRMESWELVPLLFYMWRQSSRSGTATQRCIDADPHHETNGAHRLLRPVGNSESLYRWRRRGTVLMRRQIASYRSVPAPSAVPTTAENDQHGDNDDQKRGGVHDWPPRVYCAGGPPPSG